MTSVTPAEIVYLGYIGGLGGEAIQLLELASGVAHRGIPVRVVVPALEKVIAMASSYSSVPNLRIEPTPLIRYDRVSQNPLDVLRVLHQCQPGLLHIHTGDICIPRVTLMALEVLRPRQVFATIHSATPEMAFGGGRARYWASVVPRRFQQVICPSLHGRETQIAYGLPAHKVTTIHNGIETSRFANGDGSAARRFLGVTEQTPLVVFTSRLHAQKRPLNAVEAFAKVTGEFSDARLVLVGTGPLESEVRARISALGITERVMLVGHQSNIPDWLHAATIWLQTSGAENFSLAVIEALAAGCPIVATACSGNDEILQDENNALTAPVGDTDRLAHGLSRLLRDTSLRARLKDSAIRTAARFTRDRMVDAHLACYAGERVST